MAEITNELIYEVLKSMQARLGNIEQSQKEMTTRISALQTHMLAVEKDVANLYEALAALDTRIERIEKRLDIVGEPEL
ncbi:hypothetical protein [Thermopetrobacter sp. TC1]|uniref:hypothetical protein n=1 Tax=Thermopetrobacter sp. TC1 TaxID=1495045 RepID=UPI000571718B|nr:hypothetical protein [Thermopetrobacter sp. TC1]